jgi:hypothetical protein
MGNNDKGQTKQTQDKSNRDDLKTGKRQTKPTAGNSQNLNSDAAMPMFWCIQQL